MARPGDLQEVQMGQSISTHSLHPRKPRPHEGLKAWNEALDLVAQVYANVREFPEDERFGLISQARKAATSIPANIAEGAGRGTPREYAKFLIIARGSLSELETHMQVAQRLGYLSDADLESLLDRCSTLDSLIRGLLDYQKKRGASA